MSIITRNPQPDELSSLLYIWSTVFGDTGRDSFFLHYFKPQHCIIAESGGRPAAAGYLVPFGELRSVHDCCSCGMIYSVATLPGYRGSGFGTAVVNGLISLADKLDYSAVVLCPSEDKLFEYYDKRTDLRDWFYVNELSVKNDSLSKKAPKPVKLSAREYAILRESFLSGLIHVKHNDNIFEYQSLLCDECGGGFFRIDDCCAVVECDTQKRVIIKELLHSSVKNGNLSAVDITKTISSLSQFFAAEEYIVRFPSRAGEGRRFGMAVINENFSPAKPEQNDFSPWYGIAFD